jgi:hypothetical protein
MFVPLTPQSGAIGKGGRDVLFASQGGYYRLAYIQLISGRRYSNIFPPIFTCDVIYSPRCGANSVESDFVNSTNYHQMNRSSQHWRQVSMNL